MGHNCLKMTFRRFVIRAKYDKIILLAFKIVKAKSIAHRKAGLICVLP